MPDVVDKTVSGISRGDSKIYCQVRSLMKQRKGQGGTFYRATDL